MISESPNILDLLIQGHFCRIKKSAQVAAVYEQTVKNLADRDCLIASRGDVAVNRKAMARILAISAMAQRISASRAAMSRRGDGGVNIGDRTVNICNSRGDVADPR